MFGSQNLHRMAESTFIQTGSASLPAGGDRWSAGQLRRNQEFGTIEVRS
jgi:hypothetical protein